MFVYTKESLEVLRQRIDLTEMISAYVPLNRTGASYKACCPFHQEKTPSFVIQKGDTHYHCFGCGAHGDAIAFLMTYLKMGFTEAVEHLAERFHVQLERAEGSHRQGGPNKTILRDALEKACQFYHVVLLHSQEAEPALAYLYKRGLTLDFIRHFRLGYAPKGMENLSKYLTKEGCAQEVLQETGLVAASSSGKRRDFFSERITFPILDATGHVIGFSARKFREETFGGKYINTPETLLFKKSHVLFGLSHSRHRIAKERRAIIVEGQLDALQLIYAGLNFTVAGQGTAFGEGHVKELLHLGTHHVYLALDGDEAGQEATVKIGDLFQAKGVEVSVVPLPQGKDPDSLLKEQGVAGFLQKMEESVDYLTFLVQRRSKGANLSSPSQKNELVGAIAQKIRQWESPLMIHESLRKLAALTQVPESMIGVGEQHMPDFFVRRAMSKTALDVDPSKVLETDVLRWMFLKGAEVIDLARLNLNENDFHIAVCRRLFTLCLNAHLEQSRSDLLSLAAGLEHEEDQALLSEIMQKRINLMKGKEGMRDAVHKLLTRNWMEKREAIKVKILSGTCSEDEAMALAKEFDTLKKSPPALNEV